MSQYTPPAKAIENAKAGLRMRQRYNRGGLTPAQAAAQGIESGVTRAQRISSGRVSAHDICRMAAFERHRKNSRNPKTMPDGGPSNGVIAWELWGGDEGVDWARRMKSQVGCGGKAVPAAAPPPPQRRAKAKAAKAKAAGVTPRRRRSQRRSSS